MLSPLGVYMSLFWDVLQVRDSAESKECKNTMGPGQSSERPYQLFQSLWECRHGRIKKWDGASNCLGDGLTILFAACFLMESCKVGTSSVYIWAAFPLTIADASIKLFCSSSIGHGSFQRRAVCRPSHLPVCPFGGHCARPETPLGMEYSPLVLSCQFHTLWSRHGAFTVWFLIPSLSTTSKSNSVKPILCLESRPDESERLRIYLRHLVVSGLYNFAPLDKKLGRGWAALQLSIHDAWCCNLYMLRWALGTNIPAGFWLYLAGATSAHGQFVCRTHQCLTLNRPCCQEKQALVRIWDLAVISLRPSFP